MRQIALSIAVGLAGMALFLNSACGEEEDTTATTASTGAMDTATVASFSLTSAAFIAGKEIPDEQACEDEGGSDVSPAVAWSDPPEGTVSYAIIMDDETPPCGSGDGACMHWSVFNIPLDVTSLETGEDPTAIPGVTVGRNYTGSDGYAGPCPPQAHVYKVTIYALAGGAPVVESSKAYTRSSFEAGFASFILGQDTVEGSFTPR